jgi:hypothetical protein
MLATPLSPGTLNHPNADSGIPSIQSTRLPGSRLFFHLVSRFKGLRGPLYLRRPGRQMRFVLTA